jgi:AbiV family abortive infection protein
MAGSRTYAGPLTPEQASAGIGAALRNATALLEDAELLLNAGKWPRAASLAILAIEEAGKSSIIRALLLARSDDELRQEWRAYRRHTSKNFMASFLEHGRPGAKLEDLRPLMTDVEAHRDVDDLKQLGFYSDCLAEDVWVVPDEIVGEETARALVATASLAVGPIEVPMTSTEELQLWVKHLQPVWRTGMAAMKEGLAACYREAAATGVLRGDSKPVRMAEFLDLATDAED